VTIPIESIGNAAASLSRFGDAVEVLEPPELRAELRDLGRKLHDLYS
jgi:predicted DNA-binding transcriptional regulator YafY